MLVNDPQTLPHFLKSEPLLLFAQPRQIPDIVPTRERNTSVNGDRSNGSVQQLDPTSDVDRTVVQLEEVEKTRRGVA
jgi:hypothetical protein